MWISKAIICITLFANYHFAAQIPDEFNEENDIQDEIRPPHDIRVQCNPNEILINVDATNDIFNGMIYPMGLSKNSSCMGEYGTNSDQITYRLPLRSCNTMSTQLDDGSIEFFNTVVVQPHRKLVTNKGRGFHVRCRYQPREIATKNKNGTSMGSTSASLPAKMPIVNMKIYNSESSDIVVAENVKIGDPLVIVISINDAEKQYGLFVTDCLVQDGLGWSEMDLIDSKGCSIDPLIMGQFRYNDDLTKATVHFFAHKFPHTESVYYQCSVHLCLHSNDGCKYVPPNCDAIITQSEANSRKRRDDKNRANQEEGSEAMIEVYSGLYVNEANDATKPEQTDQVSERAMDDPWSICVSQRNFAVGIAVAGLILMFLAVITILFILTRRRRPKKDISTTGSSIYSGPYTNTAYSHTS